MSKHLSKLSSGLSRRDFLIVCAGAGVALATAQGDKTAGNPQIRFGVCGDPDLAKKAAASGFDYFEWSVQSLLAPRQDESVFVKALERAKGAGIPCECLNLFIPPDLKVTGPTFDLAVLERYVKIVMERAEKAKITLVTFGSGGARRVPDKFDAKKAFEQLVSFGKMAAPIAGDHGVTISVEQLNKRECNILNVVRECYDLTRAIDHPSFRMTLDGYHWGLEKDSLEDVVAAGPMVRHVHIATWPSRFYPGGEECDLGPFFTALMKTGYSGRVSIEGQIPKPESDFPTAMELFRKLTSKSA